MSDADRAGYTRGAEDMARWAKTIVDEALAEHSGRLIEDAKSSRDNHSSDESIANGVGHTLADIAATLYCRINDCTENRILSRQAWSPKSPFYGIWLIHAFLEATRMVRAGVSAAAAMSVGWKYANGNIRDILNGSPDE